MRLIDADKVIEVIKEMQKAYPIENQRPHARGMRVALFDCRNLIENQPTVIGECKNCREADFIYQGAGSCYCLAHSTMMNADDWCSSFKEEVE